MPQADQLRRLGVTSTGAGGEFRVWSDSASTIELCIFDDRDPSWVLKSVALKRGEGGVWSGRARELTVGRRYALRVSGPAGGNHRFDARRDLLDPYARGLSRIGADSWRSVVIDDAFDWGGVAKPNTPLDRTVIYEAHLKGLTRLNLRVPAALRGTYAGLAHESTLDYLRDLGVTAVQLLPVQSFTTERRLQGQGLSNYWGYNTLGFFAPHAGYASKSAQREGPQAVLREFKGMVRLLHEAGLEVLMDVVYNHTAEETVDGPTTSFRGIDNAHYYRHDASGAYVDVTGCGNSVNFASPAPRRLVLDSLRYWANDVQIDGFRFDLAVTLGRDESGQFDAEHPLLQSIRSDPALRSTKIIAEPWDVGHGGWQTGNFPAGFSEWNDRFRDRVRDFWLTDLASLRGVGLPEANVGSLAENLAGSSHLFAADRGPLASVNFVTAHDGFTLADLTSYNGKHNLGNGEFGRDGTDSNHSYNFGVEGDTRDERILTQRRRAMRNLLGTLLLSAGIPMLTAGDEFGRSQRGNNNPYCHDSKLSWLAWSHAPWQSELRAVVKRLVQLRLENPALRPRHYAVLGQPVPSATEMAWYGAHGSPMQDHDWRPDARTVQCVAASTPEEEEFNRVLLVVHGNEDDVSLTLPAHVGVVRYRLLWDSSDDTADGDEHPPGAELSICGPTIRLYRAI